MEGLILLAFVVFISFVAGWCAMTVKGLKLDIDRLYAMIGTANEKTIAKDATNEAVDVMASAKADDLDKAAEIIKALGLDRD